ncbi:LOW QUALITY PROTEIN: uncharacterized protein LOC103506764 [Diaphorina citri]|uniref:LOW QUALITY PROTEIN: uncharacterized protein LOC103506764 n=1 Tax=Diaphorina citri TaxID=121845 RepID=A0A3Q0IMK8_DIACI|nr:LOW QUALITY PROTEIN: uncharacterized protein LOC103506764 [Diaphorina citri]
MIQISVLLLMTTLGASVWCSLPASNSSRALTFRTSLHVARSLNPESTENLSVKTKSGDLATIIVKKREGGRNIRNFWIQDDTNWKPITSTSAESVSKQRSFSANNFVTSGNVTSFDTPVKNDVSSSSSVTQSPRSDKTRSEINKIETPKNTSPQNNTADVKSTVNPDSKQDQAKSTAAPSDSNVQKLESTEVFGGITSSPYPSEKTTRSVQTSAGVSSFEVYPIQGSAGKHSGSNFVPIQSQFQARKLVPDPITVTSSMSLGNQGNTETEEDRQSRKLYVDPDGIPVITGIRVPDDESDRQVWRNARVINGILVPYAKNHNSKYPQKVSASNSHPTVQPASTQWLKSELNQKKPMPTVVKDSAAPGKWSEKKMSPTMKVSASNSHPTVQPASTQWLKSELNQKKPMSTVVKDSTAPGKWSEKKMSPTNPPPLNVMLIEEQDDKWQKLVNVMLIEEQDDKWQKLGTVYNSNNGHGQEQESKFRPSPVWIRDDVRQSQDESYVSDKILDYIKQINQHETSHRLVRKVEDRDARAFLEEEAGRSIHPRAIQRVGDNINSNYYTSSTISPPRVSFEGVRTPVLQYAHPELGVQPAKLVSTSAPQKEAELEPVLDSRAQALAYFAHDIHADRSPFAFEPVGVQPAKLVSTSAPQKEAELEPVLDSRAQALAYFAHDIHADRSPFAFEPGLEEEARVQENLDAKPVKPSTRPKKTLTYPSPKYVDSNMGHGHYNKYEYSSKYPFSYKGYGGGYYTHIHEPEKPMWKKISDSVKDHVQSGIEKMSNLTRPVVEPLMEATHKISQNLGLSSGNRDLNTIKEKVGLAGSPSILLPALGLVAGGAALGLGAVAVGR